MRWFSTAIRSGHAHFNCAGVAFVLSRFNAFEECGEWREPSCERLGRLAHVVGERAVDVRVAQEQLDRLGRLVVAHRQMQWRLPARRAHVGRGGAREQQLAHVRSVPEGRAVQRRPAVLRARVDLGAVLEKQLQYSTVYIMQSQASRIWIWKLDAHSHVLVWLSITVD